MTERTVPIRFQPDDTIGFNQGGFVPQPSGFVGGRIPDQTGLGQTQTGQQFGLAQQTGFQPEPARSGFVAGRLPEQLGEAQPGQQFGGFNPNQTNQVTSFNPNPNTNQFGGFQPNTNQSNQVTGFNTNRPDVLPPSRYALNIEPITNNAQNAPLPPNRTTRIISETSQVPVRSLGKVNYDRNFVPESESEISRPAAIPEPVPIPTPIPTGNVPSSELSDEEDATPARSNVSFNNESTTSRPLEILPVNGNVPIGQQQTNVYSSQHIPARILPSEVAGTCGVKQKTCTTTTTTMHSGFAEQEISQRDVEKEMEEEIEIEEDKSKENYDNIWMNPAGYPLIFLIFGIIVIIIINMIFIARVPATDQSGNIINSDLKWSAMIMTTAILIILAVIFAGFLYYANKATLISYQWLVFLLTFAFLILLAVFTAYIAGWWMNIGFLWAPTTAPLTTS